MIISAKHSVVFGHIPKNGGTTIQNAFKSIRPAYKRNWIILSPQQRLLLNSGKPELVRYKNGQALELPMPNGFVENDLKFDTNISLRKHSTFKDLRDFLSDKRYTFFRKVLISRNPYSRAFSSWSFLLSRALLNPNIFRKLKHLYGTATPAFSQFYEDDRWSQFIACAPQHTWLDPTTKPEYIIKLEDGPEKLHMTLEELNLEPGAIIDIMEYVRHNRNNPSAKPDSWKTILSPSDLKRVRDIYAEDFSVFGYLL